MAGQAVCAAMACRPRKLVNKDAVLLSQSRRQKGDEYLLSSGEYPALSCERQRWDP